ncbi:hypothetical protein MGYG_04617 [Nannizzia gypsea CBS 118893]|uniref:Uncharacterized protein n=1 Tax=Arthroderma gypseum (strain ATCC MYA-4604 / CBS 118893) TaxID=535722 RepID=E4UU24_ARTGP|nr:hypothetical protein MGYG_04617 [Nannizzia gypsea CBS 118893]EFR01614.1 hypothetical protein MGYG_04617 [Nannizzia gypsea CBS 118893]
MEKAGCTAETPVQVQDACSLPHARHHHVKTPRATRGELFGHSVQLTEAQRPRVSNNLSWLVMSPEMAVEPFLKYKIASFIFQPLLINSPTADVESQHAVRVGLGVWLVIAPDFQPFHILNTPTSNRTKKGRNGSYLMLRPELKMSVSLTVDWTGLVRRRTFTHPSRLVRLLGRWDPLRGLTRNPLPDAWEYCLNY